MGEAASAGAAWDGRPATRWEKRGGGEKATCVGFSWSSYGWEGARLGGAGLVVRIFFHRGSIVSHFKLLSPPHTAIRSIPTIRLTFVDSIVRC